MTRWVDGSVSFIGLVEVRNSGGDAERSCSLRHYVAEIELVGVPGPASPLHKTSLDIGMPTILRHGRWRFFFYSNEGSEPAHVHVEAVDGTAKFWLNPVALVGSSGLRSGDLRFAERFVRQNRDYLMEAWNEHFSP